MDGDLHPWKNDKEVCEFTRNALTRTIPAVSGGFAIVQPGSQLSINAVEGFPLEDFSPDVSCSSFRSGLYHAHKFSVIGRPISNY